MRIAVVTDSSNFLKRALFVAEHYAGAGHEVTLIQSDFDHATKKKIADMDFSSDPEGLSRVVIETHPYRKNISLRRLYYHSDFAHKAGALIEELKPELIYALIPANSIAPMAAEEARLCGAKLVYDIIDLWPESFPLDRFKETSPFRHWAGLRDRYLPQAKLIITECALYKEVLNIPDALVMYWFTDDYAHVSAPEASPIDEESWRIAYLGAINNIIDIPEIVRILSALGALRPISFDIIGDGERRADFLSALSAAGIDYHYHGAIYDAEAKGAILSGCDWGLNIMRPEVRAGLTMKSLDYMAAGLRLINNICGDTHELIERERIGVNIDRDQGADGIAAFGGCDKAGVKKVFLRYFSREAAEKVLLQADRIIGL